MSAEAKRVVRRFYQEVLAAGDLNGLASLVAGAYTPHVPTHKSMPRLEPGLAALEARLRSAGPVQNQPKRIIVDGDLVYAQTLYPGPPPVSGVDIFAIDDTGRIASHWNVRQALTGEDEATIAHRFAGPGVADIGDGARHRKRAEALYREVWAKGDASRAADYYTETYIQHNPHIASGLDRISGVIANIGGYIRRHGTDFPIELLHIGAEGDFAFVHLEIAMAGLGRNDGDRSTVVDIFRADGDGKFAEHWDVCHMESEGLPDHSTLF